MIDSSYFNPRVINFFNIEQGKNKGIVLTFGAFPLRILKHRGWSKDKLIYQRVMVQAEIEMVQQCRRLVSYRYDDLPALLIDELNSLGEGKSFDSEAKVLCAHFNTSFDEVLNKWRECE